MELSVVIPAYNEEAVIEGTVRDVTAYLKNNFSSYEIIVVDDGSRDNTREMIRNFASVRCIAVPQNRGKGYAVKTGVLNSQGKLILFMDADNSTNISELNHFLKDLRREHDIVIGSRALGGSHVVVSQSPLKRMLGRLGNHCIRFLLGLPIQDTQCGFKLFRATTRVIFEKQTIDRWGFDFELLFIASKMGFRILESPVTWVNNLNTKVRRGDYFKVFYELLKVRWNWLTGKYGIL